MKKLLLLSLLLIQGILFSQNNRFSKIYSTPELLQMQKSVSGNEKFDFYKQFFKAQTLENIQTKFSYKKYPQNSLIKFTDSIFSHYAANEDDLNNYEDEELISFEKYVAQEKSSDEVIKKNVDQIKKELQEQKRDSAFINRFFEMFNAAPSKTGNVKTDYEIYLNGIKKRNEENTFSVKNREKVIAALDELFARQDYNSAETFSLLQKNLDPQLGEFMFFPDVVAKHNVDGAPEIYEIFPNDIIAFDMNTGMGAGRYAIVYKVIGNDINPISVYPIDYSDENYIVFKDFSTKISKYVKGEITFDGRTGFDIKKDKSGEYLISTSMYSEEDPACCPSMGIEYKTKDFKTFVPLRIQKDLEKNKWTTIK